MYKKFKEIIEAEDGTEVFMTREHSGLVRFEMHKESEVVKFTSTSIHGYDFSLTETEFEAYSEAFPLFSSELEAEGYFEKERQDTIDKYKKEFGEDKDAFLKEMIRIAYASKCDPEYGDYDIAIAIKEVAGMYFEDFNLN